LIVVYLLRTSDGKLVIYLCILIKNLFYRSYKEEHSYVNSNQETSRRTSEQMAGWCS